MSPNWGLCFHLLPAVPPFLLGTQAHIWGPAPHSSIWGFANHLLSCPRAYTHPQGNRGWLWGDSPKNVKRPEGSFSLPPPCPPPAPPSPQDSGQVLQPQGKQEGPPPQSACKQRKTHASHLKYLRKPPDALHLAMRRLWEYTEFPRALLLAEIRSTQCRNAGYLVLRYGVK